MSLPMRLPTAESSPSDTSEPRSRKWNVGSVAPASRACIDLTNSNACWRAACARGGTSAPSRPDSGQGQAAQSPKAKTSASRVVCSVVVTTS